MRRSNRRFALLALSALTPVPFYGTGNVKALQLQQLLAGKRRLRAISRIFEQGGLSVRALWGLILVARRALLDFVALPKMGRIGAEAVSSAGPIQTVVGPSVARQQAPTIPPDTLPLPKNSATGRCPQPSEPRAEEPITGRKFMRCKPRKLNADRTAKLEKALKLLGDGQSRRSVAKSLGIAESTLRAWLKSERVACVAL
jgi:hypothetical protein